jgi:hypothetical protein
MTFRDIDGDSLLDAVLASGPGIIILRGKGDGSFEYGGQFGSGLSFGKIVAEDFNGDGRPDLAVGNFKGQGVSVLINATK